MPQQRWVRLIPVAFIMYTIAYIDRTNISLALPSLSRDLHMNPTQAGDVAGIFFWGYIALQIPGGYLASHWSAKRFVAILLVVWGLCAVGCGLVHTAREFWVMRLLLGVAESGVWPATLVLLSHWFPRAERARANAFWMLCLPVAVIFSSPLSGWILGRWNWRVLLIAEGLMPFLWLAVWLWFIADHPHQASWISPEEKGYLETTLVGERGELSDAEQEPYLRVLLRSQVLVMIGVYFLLNTANYGYLFWLPTALERTKKVSDLQAGYLFAVPYALAGIAMVLNARHSDRHGERRWHVALPLATTGALVLAGALQSGTAPVLSFALLFIAGAGAYSAHGPFWAIPTETLPRRVAGAAMGLVNALGNLGGYLGPLVVGYLYKRTGGFLFGFAALSASMLGSASLALLLRPAQATKQIPPS
ncbi:MAG TPA: MFS transporter [Terriglobia bacterium]|nr:MFS transporter [Terriglobia bacterium]